MNTQRKCNLCRETFDATKEFFYGNKTDKLGIDKRCKKCDNKKAMMRKTKQYKILKNGPCVDCGMTLPPCAMSFDHLPGLPKNKELWQLRSSSMGEKLKEIANCELVCLNCHAMRTFYRSKKD